MHKNLLLYFLYSILSFGASAQEADFQFFTTADGLSGSFTHGIEQDEQGFIWVGNDYKLHRFDGHHFTQYQPPADLPGSNEKLGGPILHHDSLLLFGNQHIFMLDPSSGSWKSYPTPADQHRSNAFFQFIGCFKNGNPAFVHFSDDSDTLDLWHFQNHQFLSPLLTHISSVVGKQLILTPDDQLCIYYRDTLELYDCATQEVTKTTLDGSDSYHQIINIHSLANDSMLMLVLRPSDTNPLLYNYEVRLFSDLLDAHRPHPVNRHLTETIPLFTRFIADGNGNLWFYGPNRILYYYDIKQDTLFDFSPAVKEALLNVDDLLQPFVDRTGTVWILTRLGLLKLALHETAFEQYLAQPTDFCDGFCSFRGFTEDEQGFVYANYYQGVVRFDPDRQQKPTFYNYDYFKGPAIPIPSDLQSTSDGLWLNNGTLLEVAGTNVRSIPGSKKGNLVEEGFFRMDKNGRLWWLYFNELFYLRSASDQQSWEKALDLPFPIGSFTDVLYISPFNGRIYISWQGKLLQYDPATKRMEWIKPQDWGLKVAQILAIEHESAGAFWLATDIGLIKLDPETGQSKQYTTKDGLPNNFVCGMLAEGDSCLWLSTFNGLSRFHKKSASFINFFEEDGLTYNEFNRKSYFKASDGRMYFGGLRGINAFYPDELMSNFRRQNEQARVALAAFEYVDEKKDTTVRQLNFSREPQIDLYHHHRSFSFEYVLTDFRNPDEVAYSYQMEGYESSWSPPSKFNFTRFSSLPSGNYVFRVKAKDSHGRWHPNQLAVHVIVHPPWWDSWWARLGYVFLFGSALFGIFYFLQKRWQLKNELKLEQAEASRLKELDGFKSRLYTNLTHEFRTPLTVILGMARQLAVGSWQSALPPDEKERMKTGLKLIDRNGNNLLRLINQLLDLSKLENKSFQLHLQNGDIVPYLRYVTESFQTYANSRNLSLRFFTTLENLEMDFDPEQIKQVMTNLISNAIKFTPSGGEVKVSVSSGQLAVGSQQPTVHCLLLTVKDTGSGIPEKDLPHVFDRFYQVDGSHTREGEGTGIGLAHSLELVHLMGGDITVESELGKGTVFQISLPVRQLAVQQSAVRQFDSPAALPFDFDQPFSEDKDWRTGELKTADLPTLLIIEDNPDVVVYLKSCLADQYQLDVAYNGKIGIEKALETIPDLIVSDVMMPEKDGYQVCDTLKNDERTSHIPIILLTAKADAASKIVGLRRGADAYLAKPFDKEELLVRLENLAVIRRKLQERFVAMAQDFPSFQNLESLNPDSDVEDAFIQKVRLIVAEHYEDDGFALPQLCQKIGMSRSQLFRKMKALIDQSPSDFIRTYRLNQAKTLLETTDLNVSEVAWKVGYKDLAHFSKSFQEAFGVLPSATSK